MYTTITTDKLSLSLCLCLSLSLARSIYLSKLNEKIIDFSFILINYISLSLSLSLSIHIHIHIHIHVYIDDFPDNPTGRWDRWMGVTNLNVYNRDEVQPMTGFGDAVINSEVPGYTFVYEYLSIPKANPSKGVWNWEQMDSILARNWRAGKFTIIRIAPQAACGDDVSIYIYIYISTIHPIQLYIHSSIHLFMLKMLTLPEFRQLHIQVYNVFYNYNTLYVFVKTSLFIYFLNELVFVI